jgi:hypothetical protein
MMAAARVANRFDRGAVAYPTALLALASPAHAVDGPWPARTLHIIVAQEWHRDVTGVWLRTLPSDAPRQDPQHFSAMFRLPFGEDSDAAIAMSGNSLRRS